MFYKDKFCTAKIGKSANYAGSVFVCVCFFFRKVDENYASPIYQKLLENAGGATRLNSLINSVTLFHKKNTWFPLYMYYPAQGKTGDKICARFAGKNVNYLCSLST